MAKFKVGDKIKALPIADKHYTFTTYENNWAGEVVETDIESEEIFPDKSDVKDIRVKEESGRTIFELNSKFFELVEKAKVKPDPNDLEIELSPELKELLIIKLPELIKKGIFTDKYKITPKGQKAILTIIKKL